MMVCDAATRLSAPAFLLPSTKGLVPNGRQSTSPALSNGCGNHKTGEVADGHAHLEVTQIDSRNRGSFSRDLVNNGTLTGMPFRPAHRPDPSMGRVLALRSCPRQE